jgi:hypothetical protein
LLENTSYPMFSRPCSTLPTGLRAMESTVEMSGSQ